MTATLWTGKLKLREVKAVLSFCIILAVIIVNLREWTPKSNFLGLNLGSSICQLCVLGQVT